MNGFLYRNIHSVHHRISVPYAFGALYSHPIETFVVDTLSDFAAMSCARLTTRQTIFFFTFAALKAVDDHCGYMFPFDPLQHISGNNSDYHDIHHQVREVSRWQ
jgi:sphinganine C4-monooxygenase